MADTKRAFVIGHPIKHSRSPLIHSFWLRRHGIDGSYQAVDVETSRLVTFLDSVRSGAWTGGNVTIPHKEAAFRLADRHDADAEAIGAVNTLWIESGRLVGGNTDAYGFAANLDQRLAGWRDGEIALVFGAGGASRAVVHALKQVGYKRIDVANRTAARALELAGQFGDPVHGHPWARAQSLVTEADLLVNTTSLGMEGQDDGLMPDLSKARTGAVATDIVYAPLETPFLRLAAEAGLPTCDGLGMLLHQAVPGFERWFGVRPEVDEALRDLVIGDLDRAA